MLPEPLQGFQLAPLQAAGPYVSLLQRNPWWWASLSKARWLY